MYRNPVVRTSNSNWSFDPVIQSICEHSLPTKPSQLGSAPRTCLRGGGELRRAFQNDQFAWPLWRNCLNGHRTGRERNIHIYIHIYIYISLLILNTIVSHRSKHSFDNSIERSRSVMGKVISWKTCFCTWSSRTPLVVVSFMNVVSKGSSHPK